MLLTTIFLAIIFLVVLIEFVSYSKANTNNTNIRYYRLVSRFNYLVIVQLSIIYWQFTLTQYKVFFTLWILLFLFYGPYLLLLISYFQFNNKKKLLNIFLKDHYLSVSFFVLISFFTTREISVNNSIKLFLPYIFIALHLFYYGVKGFYLLKKDTNNTFITIDEKNYLLKKLSFLISTLIIFAIVISVSITTHQASNNIITLFSVLYLSFLYFFLFFFRRRITTTVRKNKILTENTNNPYTRLQKNGITKDILNNTSTITEQENEFIAKQKEDLNKYQTIRLSDDLLNRIDEKVKKVILTEKAFLDPYFKITDLATKTKISRYYLSQYFTYIHNMNFPEYINFLRINEVIKIIEKENNKDEISINELFLQSAFNSKASFFKSFRNVTSMTPSQYIKSI